MSKMALTLTQRVEAERLRAKLDERRYIRRLIEAGRRGENPTAGLCATNPNPVEAPTEPSRYTFVLKRGDGNKPTTEGASDG